MIWVTVYNDPKDLERLFNDSRYNVRNWKPVCNDQQGIFYCVEYEPAQEKD